MDVQNILKHLRADLESINHTITVLARVASNSGPRRRGRPPQWLNEVRQSTGKRRGRPPGSKNKEKAEE